MTKKLNNPSDLRKHVRTVVRENVLVNGGGPYRGGELNDISRGGASVRYPVATSATSGPVEVGQLIALVFGSNAVMPARVVRISEGGFASEFDFSLKITRDPCDPIESVVEDYAGILTKVST